eukprot:296986-Hanusia_phi.AAC.2
MGVEADVEPVGHAGHPVDVHVEDRHGGDGADLLRRQRAQSLEVARGGGVEPVGAGYVLHGDEADVEPPAARVDLREPPEGIAHDAIHLVPRLRGPHGGRLDQRAARVDGNEAVPEVLQEPQLPLLHLHLLLDGEGVRALQALPDHLEEQVEAVRVLVVAALLVQRDERQRAELVARDQEADELLVHVPRHRASRCAGRAYPGLPFTKTGFFI